MEQRQLLSPQQVRGALEASLAGLWTSTGTGQARRVTPVDLSRVLNDELWEWTMAGSEGDAYQDALARALYEHVRSPVPYTALLVYEAIDWLLERAEMPLYRGGGHLNREAKVQMAEALLGPRQRATGAIWEASCARFATEEEIDLSKGLLSRGGIEGYEIRKSAGVLEPHWMKDPLKFIPLSVSQAFLRTSGQEFPMHFPFVRFVVADESIHESEQVDNLMRLSRSFGSPLLLLCWRISPVLAEDLGRLWRTGAGRIIPFSAEETSMDSLFRINILADTCWITGSDLCSHLTRRSVRVLQAGDREVSKEFPMVTINHSGFTMPAYSTRSLCRTRAQQLLNRIDGADEHGQVLKQRAAYINGIAAQLFLPEDTKANPSSIDLCVSLYREYMSGVTEWKGPRYRGYYPYEAAINAVRQAASLHPLQGVMEILL